MQGYPKLTYAEVRIALGRYIFEVAKCDLKGFPKVKNVILFTEILCGSYYF